MRLPNQDQPCPLLRQLFGQALETLLPTLLQSLLEGCQQGGQELIGNGLDVKIRPNEKQLVSVERIEAT